MSIAGWLTNTLCVNPYKSVEMSRETSRKKHYTRLPIILRSLQYMIVLTNGLRQHVLLQPDEITHD